VAIAGRRFSWCNRRATVSVVNLELRLLEQQGYAPALPVTDERRSYATTPVCDYAGN